MCGELNFPLYEIAKILDIHISHPILFIKSITCGQCQKMKYVEFEFYPIWIHKNLSQWINCLNIGPCWQFFHYICNSRTQEIFLALNSLSKLFVKMSQYIAGNKCRNYGTGIEMFNPKCVILKKWNNCGYDLDKLILVYFWRQIEERGRGLKLWNSG